VSVEEFVQMADKDDGVTLDEGAEVEEVVIPPEGEEVEQEAEAAKPEDSEVRVSIGEESPPQEDEPAPEWVRELRKNYRELQKKNRELEAKQNAPAPDVKTVQLGAKPSLEACDYDAERFEKELEGWYTRKREIETQETQKRAAQESEQEAWNKKLEGHEKAKAELKIKMPDFDDYEAVALDHLSQVQQAVIVSGAANSALVFAALGSNPKKAKELASITDPVKFAFAVANLENQVKVTPRKAPPPPESTVHGSGRGSGKADATLARLEADAAKTGDRTKIFQYKQSLRDKK
jgi:hypothetical protein